MIGQNSSGSFINSQKYEEIDYSTFRVFSYDISCDKDYYFVLSYTSKELLYEPHYAQFSIIDSTNDIKLSPLLSYSFFINQRKNKESIFYSYNETKYGFLTFDIFSTVQIFKNDILIKEMKYDSK